MHGEMCVTWRVNVWLCMGRKGPAVVRTTRRVLRTVRVVQDVAVIVGADQRTYSIEIKRKRKRII